MYKINVAKLDGKVSEKGYNKTSFSKEIGVSRRTYSSYRANPNMIPYRILIRMISTLCEDIEDAKEIFFTS